MSKPEAGRRMKLLRFLDNFPIVRAAYRGGELSTEHVSALLSALMSLPPAAWDAVEGPFVEQARFGSPQDVSDMVDDILTEGAPRDGAECAISRASTGRRSV